jgi:putative DNA primase/helicase
VLESWYPAFGTDQVTVKDVVDRATDFFPQQKTEQKPEQKGLDLNRSPRREFLFPRLREALLVVAGEGGNINSKRLGKWLGKEKGRIVKGMRIVTGLADRHWRIECV